MVNFKPIFLKLLLISSRELAEDDNCKTATCYKKNQAGARTYNPDILLEPTKCMSTCLNDARGVCQDGNLSSTSYCCNDATDCKRYQDSIGTGFCSSFVT